MMNKREVLMAIMAKKKMGNIRRIHELYRWSAGNMATTCKNEQGKEQGRNN